MMKKFFLSLLAFSIFWAQLPLTAFSATDLPSMTTAFIDGEAVADDRGSLAENALENLDSRLSEAQFEALSQLSLERLNRGLIGFDGDYALPSDTTAVSVIVVFESSPVGVQILEASLEGESLSESEAEAVIDFEHDLFRQELSHLFGNQRARHLAYQIQWEYRVALNGVSMTLPANLVAEVANFTSVRAIYPNVMVYLDPVDVVQLEEVLRNPEGMAPGRATMRADELHALGYRGEGIVVAVLDTGIDYYHPAFEGAFLTLAEAQQLNPQITEADTIHGYFFGRNFIDDVALFPNLQNPQDAPRANDPMETTYEFWRGSGLPRTNPDGSGRFDTAHGTHVAGTIVGRDTGVDVAILGVAPEARMFAYRVLGPRGGGPNAGIVAAMEQAVLDGADIVNMSLGGPNNTPAAWPTTTAVNNLKLANPYLTFVISAGNWGEGLYTMASPGTATKAITVSNIAESGNTHVVMVHNGLEYDLSFGATPGNWLSFDEERGLSFTTSSRAVADEAGAYRIFALPRTNEINGTINEAPGVGTASDFEQLVAHYGSDALAGAFVLIRRGYPFVAVAESAEALGLAGVIVVNNTDENDVSNVPMMPLPYVFMALNDGLELYRSIVATGNLESITFTDLTYIPMRLNLSSSRGPVFQSFEIKPDLGANGTNVFSAVPPWWQVDGGTDHELAYAHKSGTSMSAPHVAGAVALMMEYSRERSGQWTAAEIKVRLMNTSMPFETGFYSVFEKGTGYVDVVAAVTTDVLVSVLYDRVAVEAGTPFSEQPFQLTRTGSFSFGGYNVAVADVPLSRSLTAVITNERDTAQTFALSYSFNYGPNFTENPRYVEFALSHSTLTVPANGEASFTAQLEIPAEAPLGSYEGHVYVRNTDTDELVARLPFAGVRDWLPPAVTEIALYRPVISTSPEALNTLANELGVIFTANGGFGFNSWLMNRADGLDVYNWESPEFADSMLGFAGSRTVWEVGMSLGQPYRGIVFEGYYAPEGQDTWMPFAAPEGDYYLVLEIFRQTTDEGGWIWEQNILLPFAIDNTPPTLNIHDLEAIEVEGQLTYVFTAESLDPIYVSGNVHDAWLGTASEQGVSFDIWREESGAAQNFNAVWVNIGSLSSFRVDVDADGYFEIPLGNIHTALPLEITVTAIDNFSVVPEFDAILGTQSLYSWTNNSDHFFRRETGGLVFAPTSLHPNLRLANLWGFYPNPLFDYHVWTGLNATEFTFVVDGDFEFEPLDPNRPMLTFEYTGQSSTFTELSDLDDYFWPITSLTIDFGRVFEEFGAIEDDRLLVIRWLHESSDGVAWQQPLWTLRNLGINPYDPSTHIYTREFSSYFHPLNRMAENNREGMSNARWFDGDWRVEVMLGLNHLGDSETIPVVIDLLDEGGIAFDEADFPTEVVYIEPGEQVEFTFDFEPLVENYDNMAFMWWREGQPNANFLFAMGSNIFFADELEGYAVTLAYPENPNTPHILQTWGSYRLYAWVQVDGQWQFADTSPSIEFNSTLSQEDDGPDSDFEYFLQLVELITDILTLELDELEYSRRSWEAFEMALFTAFGFLEDFFELPENQRPTAQETYSYLRYRLDNLELWVIPVVRILELVLEIEMAELEESHYTSESWSNFQNALDTAWMFLIPLLGDGFLPWSEQLEVIEIPDFEALVDLDGLDERDGDVVYDYLRYRFEGLELVEEEEEPVSTPEYPEWNHTAIFNTGDRVLHHGRVFEAQWWTQNEQPGSSPWGAWMEIGSQILFDSEYVPTWTDSNVFDTGDIVYFDGYFFRAQWWTRNQSPRTQWGPWQVIRAR